MLKKYWPHVSIVALLLLAFAGVARAAGAAVGDEGSLLDLARPVWDAIAHGQYWMAGSLALVAAVAAFKRYAPGKLRAWSHTDVGGSLLVLLGSFGGALATGLAAVGTNAISWLMCYAALKVALAAAGGFTLLKKLVVDPLLRPLAAKAPSWMQPLFMMVFWFFDRPAIAEAEKAGDAAVAAQPSTGLAGSSGTTPTEIN